MTGLPAHIERTAVVTTKYHCHQCGAHLIPGGFNKPGQAAEVLQEWLVRHQHAKHQHNLNPTEGEPQ